MIRRVIGSTMVLAALMLAGETVYAAPAAAFHSSDVPAKVKTKMVSFRLRNDSNAPVKVKAGDQELTLEPGKPMPVKLPEGATVVAEETTPSFAAGTVLATASSSLSDATVALK
jgi:hypothetical protein